MIKSVPANQFWFQNSLLTIRVSMSDDQDGISVLEHRVPYGFSPPLHIRRAKRCRKGVGQWYWYIFKKVSINESAGCGMARELRVEYPVAIYYLMNCWPR